MNLTKQNEGQNKFFVKSLNVHLTIFYMNLAETETENEQKIGKLANRKKVVKIGARIKNFLEQCFAF